MTQSLQCTPYDNVYLYITLNVDLTSGLVVKVRPDEIVTLFTISYFLLLHHKPYFFILLRLSSTTLYVHLYLRRFSLEFKTLDLKKYKKH